MFNFGENPKHKSRKESIQKLSSGSVIEFRLSDGEVGYLSTPIGEDSEGIYFVMNPNSVTDTIRVVKVVYSDVADGNLITLRGQEAVVSANYLIQDFPSALDLQQSGVDGVSVRLELRLLAPYIKTIHTEQKDYRVLNILNIGGAGIIMQVEYDRDLPNVDFLNFRSRTEIAVVKLYSRDDERSAETEEYMCRVIQGTEQAAAIDIKGVHSMAEFIAEDGSQVGGGFVNAISFLKEGKNLSEFISEPGFPDLDQALSYFGNLFRYQHSLKLSGIATGDQTAENVWVKGYWGKYLPIVLDFEQYHAVKIDFNLLNILLYSEKSPLSSNIGLRNGLLKPILSALLPIVKAMDKKIESTSGSLASYLVVFKNSWTYISRVLDSESEDVVKYLEALGAPLEYLLELASIKGIGSDLQSIVSTFLKNNNLMLDWDELIEGNPELLYVPNEDSAIATKPLMLDAGAAFMESSGRKISDVATSFDLNLVTNLWYALGCPFRVAVKDIDGVQRAISYQQANTSTRFLFDTMLSLLTRSAEPVLPYDLFEQFIKQEGSKSVLRDLEPDSLKKVYALFLDFFVNFYNVTIFQKGKVEYSYRNLLKNFWEELLLIIDNADDESTAEIEISAISDTTEDPTAPVQPSSDADVAEA